MTQAQGNRTGMGTTLTLGLIEGLRLHLAHVGDSRAYLLRRGELRPLTQDHSWVAGEVRAGRLSPEAAAVHPRRNLLTRALGANGSVAVDSDTVALEKDDLVIFSSDGLHGVVPATQLSASLQDSRDLQAASNRLIREANAQGGPDNITVLVARIGGSKRTQHRKNANAATLINGRRRVRKGILRRLLFAPVLIPLALVGLGRHRKGRRPSS